MKYLLAFMNIKLIFLQTTIGKQVHCNSVAVTDKWSINVLYIGRCGILVHPFWHPVYYKSFIISAEAETVVRWFVP